MKRIFLFVMVAGLVFGCGQGRKGGEGEKTEGKVAGEMAGGTWAPRKGLEGRTPVWLLDEKGTRGEDTVAYEFPQYQLWFTDTLEGGGTGDGEVRAWTERERYRVNEEVVVLWVENGGREPLTFGRGWEVEWWNGELWTMPELRRSIVVWEDDKFTSGRGGLRYCFRVPVGIYYFLPEGRYRVGKRFWQEGREFVTWVEFSVPEEVGDGKGEMEERGEMGEGRTVIGGADGPTRIRVEDGGKTEEGGR